MADPGPRPKQLQLDSDGDIIYKFAGAGTALPIGVNGQNLQVVDDATGAIAWSPAQSALVFACPVSVAVTDVVHISASGTVDKASSESGAGQTGDPVGVVVSKPSTTTAVVVFSGAVGGFSGLTPGTIQFQDPSTPGGITATPPSGSGERSQLIGTASTATELIVDLKQPILIV